MFFHLSEQMILQAHALDNVAIVTLSEGLDQGQIVRDDIVASEPIAMGEKVSLVSLKAGDPIVRYGSIIGYARVPKSAGRWIRHGDIVLPEAPVLQDLSWSKAVTAPVQPLQDFAFEGYRNADGSVGTKNILGITNSVQCVAGMTDMVVKRVKEELLPKYRHVDDVVGLKHSYGCGVAIEVPDARIPIRTLQNLALNPNFGGEVMVLGLGCEKLRPERLLSQMEAIEHAGGDQVLYMQDHRLYGFSDMMAAVMQMAEEKLRKLNTRRRETCDISALTVGMQCGGSDSLSGVTGNQVAGFVADLIVRGGGTVFFSEVTEVRDAAHLLVPRAVSGDVAAALVREMSWYDEYLQRGGADRAANPTPGNKSGGLSNVVEKALGSVIKAGSMPIVDVLGPGERMRRQGLNFVATPASDFVCGTLQMAAGMNLHLFVTGRGTPYGLGPVPVIKISSNTALAERWYDLIDFDAGRIISSGKSVAELGWELFRLMLEVASGKKIVAADRLGLHNDLVLFNPGPLT